MNSLLYQIPVTHPSISALREIRNLAEPLTGSVEDYDGLMDSIGDAQVVMLGEASHGTHEFYRERIKITQRLIEEKGFTAVKHQREVGTGYFDSVTQAIQQGQSSTTALHGSTEDEQFL